MKTQFKLGLIFLSIFAVSFLPQQFPHVFGDWKCQGSGERIVDGKGWDATYHYSKCQMFSYHNSKWHWGFRHYLLLAMGITFTAINVIKIINDESKK